MTDATDTQFMYFMTDYIFLLLFFVAFAPQFHMKYKKKDKQ